MTIILMRNGDHYEAHGENARAISAAMNSTGPDDGHDVVRVPRNTVERAITQLIAHGHRVALLETETGTIPARCPCCGLMQPVSAKLVGSSAAVCCGCGKWWDVKVVPTDPPTLFYAPHTVETI